MTNIEVFFENAIVISPHAVQQAVAYGHYRSFLKDGSFLPNDRLQKILTSYPPTVLRMLT